MRRSSTMKFCSDEGSSQSRVCERRIAFEAHSQSLPKDMQKYMARGSEKSKTQEQNVQGRPKRVIGAKELKVNTVEDAFGRDSVFWAAFCGKTTAKKYMSTFQTTDMHIRLGRFSPL